MTLEEVIKRLRWQQESYNKNYIDHLDHLDINEAYNVAIKKLEDLNSQNEEDESKGDLISREALKLNIDKFIGYLDEDMIYRIKVVIDNAPTVCGNNPKWCERCISKGKCASTRPQGKWRPLSLKTLNGDDIVAYESSCCGAIADKRYQHCPKCRAKMKRGEEE